MLLNLHSLLTRILMSTCGAMQREETEQKKIMCMREFVLEFMPNNIGIISSEVLEMCLEGFRETWRKCKRLGHAKDGVMILVSMEVYAVVNFRDNGFCNNVLFCVSALIRQMSKFE